MARKLRIKFHYDGFNDLRKDPAVRDALYGEAMEIAARAAGMAGLTYGFEDDSDFVVHESANWKTRSRFTVVANSYKARAAEARSGVLTKALRG